MTLSTIFVSLCAWIYLASGQAGQKIRAQSSIPVDHVVDLAFLSDKIWTTDNPGFLTDRNTGASFQVDHELNTNTGRIWLVRTRHRGGQAGDCIIVARDTEIEASKLQSDYKFALVLGAIKAIPEKIPGTNFYVMKQYNEMGSRFIHRHGLIIGTWMGHCSKLGKPNISLTGHSLGGAVATWLAYSIAHKAGPNLFGTQSTNIRVGELVTFDAPPIHFPSKADAQDICPKALQTKNVAVNFLRGGYNPKREDSSFKNLVWSPWSIKGNLMGELAEELTEGFFNLIGRDCIGFIDLGREFFGTLVTNIDVLGWIAANDESQVYHTLLNSAGEYDRRDQFLRFCGDKGNLIDFGCGCGWGFKRNGKCPPKVEYRTEGTCPVFSGLFDGVQKLVIMDKTKTIDAEACAEFCTAIDGCKSWRYYSTGRDCFALNDNKNIERKSAAPGNYHGLPCPKINEAWIDSKHRYWTGEAKDVTRIPLNMDLRGQSLQDVCAEWCGTHPGCQSWTLYPGKKECYTFQSLMPNRRPQADAVSGLPKRVVMKNRKVEHMFEPQCCSDHSIWTDCAAFRAKDCPQGYNHDKSEWCGFAQRRSLCEKKCNKFDYGCGCGRTCLLGHPPQSHEGFVRFCPTLNTKFRCCDQAGSPSGRNLDLNVLMGCPHDGNLSSIEVVGNCKVDLYTKPNRGGSKFTISGAGQYRGGSGTFPYDAIVYSTITCKPGEAVGNVDVEVGNVGDLVLGGRGDGRCGNAAQYPTNVAQCIAAVKGLGSKGGPLESLINRKALKTQELEEWGKQCGCSYLPESNTIQYNSFRHPCYCNGHCHSPEYGKAADWGRGSMAHQDKDAKNKLPVCSRTDECPFVGFTDGYVKCGDMPTCQVVGTFAKITLEDCKQRCCANADCKAVDWNPNVCFLKTQDWREAQKQRGRWWYAGKDGQFNHWAKLHQHHCDGNVCSNERPGCWTRMPSGCAKALKETYTPQKWFVDSFADASTCGQSRLASYNGHCGKTDAEQIWGAAQPIIRFTYVGCYKNESANRVNGHEKHRTIEECGEAAVGGFFGMEYPQGTFREGRAQCLVMEGLPKMDKTDDAECGFEKDSDGRRLGNASRLAVYTLQ